jgi:hypothetical protein
MCTRILRRYFDEGQLWGEHNTQHTSNQGAFEIARSKIGGILACTVCFKILPVSEMFSIDACSEECQGRIKTDAGLKGVNE